MIRRSIREWGRLPYGDDEADESTIPAKYADRLAKVARDSDFSGRGKEGVLEHGRKGLRARGIVGVIAAPGCQLEILPKIGEGRKDKVKPSTLHERLIHMLLVVHDLRIETGSMAQLNWQHDTILELLIRIFCKNLINAVRRGMPHHYLAHEDDLPALRGRLDVIRQFSTLAASPQKLACRFDSLSPDLALNRVMRAAIVKLLKLAAAPDNQRSLRELSFAYAEIADVPVKVLLEERKRKRIVIDRTNQRWESLLSHAWLFLEDQYQQTSEGMIDGHALLFEMNVLFEKYVARILPQALAGMDLHVSTQDGEKACLYEGEDGRFRTRPDIIVKRGGREVLIIDTKWKRIASRIDDPKQGVSQADVYQLMAYGRLYDCPNVLLLYPHHSDLPPEPIFQRYSIAERNADEALSVATLNLCGNRRDHQKALRDLIKCLGICVPQAQGEANSASTIQARSAPERTNPGRVHPQRLGRQA